MRETLRYFMDAYVDYCYANLNYIFTNQADIHVADSLLHIFEFSRQFYLQGTNSTF